MAKPDKPPGKPPNSGKPPTNVPQPSGDVLCALVMAKATTYQGELVPTSGGGAGLTMNSSNPTGVTITVYQPDARAWMTAPLRSSDGTYFTKWQRNGVDYDTASTTSLIPGTDTMTAVYTTPSTAGVSVSPGTDTLAAALALNPPGTTYLLLAGTHVMTAGVVPDSGDIIQGENDGEGNIATIVSGSVGGNGGFLGYDNINVTLRNLIIENFTGDGTVVGGADLPIKGGDGWLIANCEMRNNRLVGVVAYNSVVRNNWIHDNEQYGALGSPGTFEGNVMENNNTAHYDPTDNAGGSKFLNSADMQVRGNTVNDNYGHGLWSDYNNTGTLYENNICRNNFFSGIDNEVNCNTIIRYNVLDSNNSGTDGSLWNGGQIFSRGSSNLQIYGNDITVGTGKNAIATRWDGNTYDTPQCGVMGATNVDVNANVIRLAVGSLTGFVGNSTTISFSENVYDLPDPDGLYFIFGEDSGGVNVSFAAWQALGQDV